MEKLIFSKDDIAGIMKDLCDDYNKSRSFESLNDKIYKVLILIAICELSRLYQSQFDEPASQDLSLQQM